MDKNIKATGIKAAALSVVTFFFAWLATKILDGVFDISTVSYLWDQIKIAATFLRQEIPNPLWHLLAIIFTGLVLLALLIHQSRSLRNVEYEIEKLKKPPAPIVQPTTPLSDTEHSVIMTIAGFLENNKCPDDTDIMHHLCLTPLPTQAAIDVLTEKALIKVERDSNFFTYWELTPQGRKYALDPDNLKRT